uniref:Uncharacterized protein n=1 Tax=Nelumbo nucifera TaxID=4432 RepID=A0A822XKW3_NELNU|nr:TPA_asm: hypothetical protein HUJ06_020918 [Nelumbo nucifera]
MGFEGRAMEWFCWAKDHQPSMTWEQLVEAVDSRFNGP